MKSINFAQVFCFLLFIVSVSLPQSSHAFLSISETGELTPQSEQRMGFTPQFLMTDGSGANFGIFAEAGTSEATSTRVLLEGGDINFNAFASLKYIPFPDVDDQPAIGVRIGLGLAREGSQNNLYAQVAPLASKMIDTQIGTFIPFASLPFDFNSTKEENFVSNRFVVGTEYRNPEETNVHFGGEIGFEMNRSFSYVSLYFTFILDSGLSY
jgi:hypothetical protein